MSALPNCSLSEDLDRELIRQNRRLRNKEKRVQKQEENRNKRLLKTVKVQQYGQHLSLITNPTSEVAKPSNSSLQEEFDLEDVDFPEISDQLANKQRSCKPTYLQTDRKNGIEQPPKSTKIKSNKAFTRKLEDIIVIPSRIERPNVTEEESKSYSGNSLDASKPKRVSGKIREVPKKDRVTTVKQSILTDEEIRRKTEEIELIKYINYEITADLLNSIDEFLDELVDLQEKMFSKNPIKAQIKRRYVVGFHEATKNILGNRVKLLIIATDIQITRLEDTLFESIRKITEQAADHNVEYIFALTRSRIGVITKKFRRISCVAILNADGINDKLNDILRIYKDTSKADKIA